MNTQLAPRSAHLALVLALLGGAATAQPELEPPAPAHITRRSCALAEANGELRGGGPDYKVRFDARGLEFVPALGRRAPRSYPFRLTYQSATRDGAAVGESTVVTPQLDAQHVSYRRGDGMTERFEVRPTGVELSYRFAKRPQGRGDLVVRLRVDTDLHVDRPDAGGLRFLAKDLGGVRVGGVTGVDRDGRRARGSLRSDGRHLELILPGDFVDSAAYPMVLDPLIETERLIGGGGGWDDAQPDVAWDHTNIVFLVVWQREFSAVDVDIRAQRVTRSGLPIGSFLAVRSPISGVALNPTVANVQSTDQFLVCWQEGPTVFGPFDIRGACVDAATGLVSTHTVISQSAGNQTDPDAGSEPTLVDDEALVVWRNAAIGIRGAEVTCPPGGPPSAAPAVTLIADTDVHDPAISKTGEQRTSGTGKHLVVARQGGAGLQTALVDRDLNVLGNGAHGPTGSPAQVGLFDVDGNGKAFLVAWEQYESGGTGNRDVYCQMVDWDAAAGQLRNRGAPVAVASRSGIDERTPAVAWVRFKYVVVWARAQVGGGFLAYDLAGRALNLSNCLPCGPEFALGTSGRTHDYGPQIGSFLSGGSNGDKCLIVWGTASSTPPFASEVRSQRFEAVGTGGAVADVGGGCGTGGTAGVNGAVALGNKSFAFTLSGADPTATAALLVLGSAATPIPCGTCQITTPVVAVPQAVAGGAAQLAMPIACGDPALIGGTIQAQWWVVTPPAVHCSLLPSVSFSSRVDATLGL